MTAPFTACGIGDLHLDGNLSKYVPDLNNIILNEVRSVLNKVQKKGITNCFLYGDICNKNLMSYEAHQGLLDVFHEYKHFTFYVIRGNHDAKTETLSALNLLESVTKRYVKNVRMANNEPRTFLEDTDTPINLLPWPFTDTQRSHLNVLHVDAAGAKMDTGRPVEDGFSTRDLCLVGHLHTAQSVRNTHYSGTLYQTNFGEAPEKFFHAIKWTGNLKTSSVQLVPHSPSLVLKNVVVASKKDYAEFMKTAELTAADSTQRRLYKIFIDSSKVILPSSAFDTIPGVIKIVGYEDKAELKALVTEELELEYAGSNNVFDLKENFQEWMNKARVEPALQSRALDKLADYTRLPVSD